MFDFMMTKEQLALRDEVRDLVKWVPRQMILDMDADKLVFPKEFLAEAGRRNLMGCRYPKEWGGRGLDWQTTVMVMEEVGVLGYIFACVFGVGAELVCDAIILHGTDAQKEKYVKPLLQGRDFCGRVPDRTAGRVRFFRHHHPGRRQGRLFSVERAEALYRGGGSGGLLPGVRAHRFFVRRQAPPGPDLFCGRSRAGGGDRLSVRAHGLPGRRGRAGGVQGRQGAQGKTWSARSAGPMRCSTP